VGNEKISITEFLSATLKAQDFLSDENLWALFNEFDEDGKGTINANDLHMMFQRNAKTITISDAEELIKEHGSKGELSFTEFKDVFLMNAEDGSVCSPTPFLKQKTPSLY